MPSPARSRPFRRVAVVACAFAACGVLPGAIGSAAPVPAAPWVGAATDPAVRVAGLTAAARRAQARLGVATARVTQVRSALATAEAQLAEAAARTDAASRAAAAARAEAERARRQVEVVAAAAYREGAGGSALARLLSSDSITQLTYRRELVGRVAAERRTVIRRSRRAEVAARAAEATARATRDALAGRVAALRDALGDAEAAHAAALETAARTELWLSRWQAVAWGSATSILGVPALGAEEMAAWFRAGGRRSRATVPIEELAALFVDEGRAAFVRGDIAFAQSILETGWFRFPDGGQVRPDDNNFAGIGACDSCTRGRIYPDARTGVRAQMQLLRVYADANLRNGDLNPPAVDPRLDRHHLKGRVTSWAGLSGTWATAAGYGERILGIYFQMLAWLTDRAGL